MTTTVSLTEAQANLKSWLDKLSPGDCLLITDENALPVAELRLPQRPTRPQPNVAAGMVIEYVDDDEHLKDFAEYMP
jgi:antitoxin (DNA-binding transcriptional repressor) of toxin-antitoxin stability system